LNDDEFDLALTGSRQTQETFDNTATWRQARVNLSEFAGRDNLKLRFEFSTAGGMGMGANGGTGPQIRVLPATRLEDGQQIVVNGQVLEIEMGPTLVIPSGAQITNGDSVQIEGKSFVFYDGTGPTPAGDVIVAFNATQPAEMVAASLLASINGTTFNKPSITGVPFSQEALRLNDTISTAAATPIGGNSVIVRGSGVIGDTPALDRDVDMIRMQLDRGASVTVTAVASLAAPRLDSYLRIFDASGRELASNNDFGGSTDSQASFVASETGTYYIGVSAANNTAYSAVVGGTSLPGGSNGTYELTIDVTRMFVPTLVGARLQLEGAVTVSSPTGSPIVVTGASGTLSGNPLYINLAQSAQQVGQTVQQTLASQFANGQASAFRLHDDFLTVQGLNIVNPGPFGFTDTRIENQFSEHAIINGSSRPALRARNNAFEGLYLDDFIIGAAERGEVALNAAGSSTTFVANPAGVSGIQVGQYQLEIRSGSEYGQPNFPTNLNDISLVDTFENGQRLADGQNIRFLSGPQIADGSTFTISDGVNRVTFEFEDSQRGNGVRSGNVPIPFTSSALNAQGNRVVTTASQIAATVRNVINGPLVQSILNASAIMINGDITGATSDTLAIFGPITITVPTTVGELIVSRGLGDQNRPREQGQVVIENSRFFRSSEVGIRLRPDARDPVADASSPGSVRNTVVLNNERLAPGAVIRNNEIVFSGNAGISVAGEAVVANRVAGAVPFARIVNNTIVGGTVSRPDTFDPTVVNGIFFPGGDSSWADAVVSYQPGTGQGAPIAGLQTPANATGVPDFPGNREPLANQGVVSLGRGGQIVVRFNDNFLSASGDSRPDLYVSEVGDREDVSVEVSTDGIQFRSVGRAGGSVRTIDLDAAGILPTDRFFFVRLTDDPNQGATSGDSVGADIDAIGAIRSSLQEQYSVGGVGILVGPNASPTLLNNVLVNNTTGLQIDPTSTSTVVGGTLFQRNAANLGGQATLGQFPIVANNNTSLFVDPAGRVFYPADRSPVIDSSIDSLQDRLNLLAVKQPLGLDASPILAPARDVNGLLRVDDPAVDTPAGFGENVFKDRGANDRADFVGPSAFVVNPRDNDTQGTDSNSQQGVVELTNAALTHFDVQIIDSAEFNGASQGTGIRHSTVNSNSVLIYKNNVPLVEGVDYRFGYDSTNGIVRLTPLSGVWAGDAVYTIRLLNTVESSVQLLRPASYVDGSSFTVFDSSGRGTTFEIDLGIQLQIPSDPLTNIHTITDGNTFQVDDGRRRLTFEFDTDGIAAVGNVGIPILATDTAETVAAKMVAVVRTQGLQLSINALQAGAMQILGGRAVRFLAGTSGISAVGSAGVQSAFGLRIPTEGGAVVNVADGQKFSLTLGNGGTATFEIDTNGIVAPENRAVPYNPTMTPNQLADSIVNAIARAGLGLTPRNTGEGFIALDGDFDLRLDLLDSVFTSVGVAGVDASNPITIDLSTLSGSEQVAAIVTNAIRAANLPGVSLTIFGDRVFIEGALGVVGSGASPVDAIRDQAGNPIRSNQINGRTEVTIFLGRGLDFGDAPEPWASTSALDGARHTVVNGFSLGPTVTVDADARVTDQDTDDGVRFTQSLVAAFNSQIVVNATGITASRAGFLNAWIDYDADGQFELSERIATLALVNGDNPAISFRVPSTARVGETYARFRFSSSASAIATPTGEAIDGEVEDYRITIQGNPYKNPSNNLDVSCDGAVSPIDSLQVINFINLNGPSTTLTLPVNRPLPPYLDVNGDGAVTAIDALLVINFLNLRGPGGEGEGESAEGWISTASSHVTVLGGVTFRPETAREQEVQALPQESPSVNSQPSDPGASSVFADPVAQAIEDLLSDQYVGEIADAHASQFGSDELFASDFWKI
jgi:hypothetical protein